MTAAQKARMAYLQEQHWGEWSATRNRIEREMSDQQPLFCICGRLATGMHERGCARFRNKVNAATITALKHLWKEARDGK